MQIPIISGIYSDNNSDYRTSYPRNLVPVPKSQGISSGYLRPAPGIIQHAQGPGIDRGGIEWNGICYRVMGSSLVRVDDDGTVTVIGDVGNDELFVTMDYSFQYLSVSSNNNLFLYDGTTLAQVTDANLGDVTDHLWLDGYFVTTDREFIVVTQLGDPFSVNLLRYGSSEIDPDPIIALVELRNEVAAVNQYTIEFFDNFGGSANQFPFQRIDGAQIERGAVGTHAVTVFAEALAFIGRARDESPAVWLGRNGGTTKLSTREVDQILKNYGEDILSKVKVETRTYDSHDNLYIHLPNETLVYDQVASAVMQRPIWYTLDSGNTRKERYRAVNFVYAYDRWLCGDHLGNIGELRDDISSHYGDVISWNFSTSFTFNEAMGFICHEVKLTGLSGRSINGKEPHVWHRWSHDGVKFSSWRPKRAGRIGDRSRAIEWYRQGRAKQMRIFEFRGTSDAHIGVARLDARMQPLAH